MELNLENFTGTEHYYKHWLGKVYTDGVKYIADQCGAHWLLDAVFSYKRNEPLQVWNLKVNQLDNSALLAMVEDKGEPALIRQEIPYTDFPLEEIELWLLDGTTLILPSEY